MTLLKCKQCKHHTGMLIDNDERYVKCAFSWTKKKASNRLLEIKNNEIETCPGVNYIKKREENIDKLIERNNNAKMLKDLTKKVRLLEDRIKNIEQDNLLEFKRHILED